MIVLVSWWLVRTPWYPEDAMLSLSVYIIISKPSHAVIRFASASLEILGSLWYPEGAILPHWSYVIIRKKWPRKALHFASSSWAGFRNLCYSLDAMHTLAVHPTILQQERDVIQDLAVHVILFKRPHKALHLAASPLTAFTSSWYPLDAMQAAAVHFVIFECAKFGGKTRQSEITEWWRRSSG